MSDYSWMSEDLKRKSIFMSKNELAWKIMDACHIIREALANQVLVLGGDILNSKLKYTCDSWYYRPGSSFSKEEKSTRSCAYMKEYICKFVEYHGTDFYVVVILTPQI